MFRMALLALILVWTSAAAAPPATDADIDRARADVARFCAADIERYVAARKAEADPYARKTPEQEVAETFEHLLKQWGTPPDLNLVAYYELHAGALARFARDPGDPGVWVKRTQAEARMLICINGRATVHYGELQSYVVVQNKTTSTAKLMTRSTNYGEMEPGETKVYRFGNYSETFRINVNGVDTYGPTTVNMKAGETLVLSFGDAGNALSVAQPPPLD